VTYTVVVKADNRDSKLLPGMTANLVFQIEKRCNVLLVPNAALRFRPKSEQVRKSDLPLLGSTGVAAQTPAPVQVWIANGDQLAAVKVVTGLS
jgi:HlyD family secretion protein